MVVFIVVDKLDSVTKITNVLSEFILTRPVKDYEFVVFGTSVTYRDIKRILTSHPLCDFFDFSFIPMNEKNKVQLNEYVNLKTLLKLNDLFYGVNSVGNVKAFLVEAKYEGIKLLTKLYDSCLYTKKGIISGSSVIKFEDPYINIIYKRVIRKLSNFINYELLFLNPSTSCDNHYLTLCEKDRLMELSFNEYKNRLLQLLKDNRFLTSEVSFLLNQRVTYIKRLERLSHIYYEKSEDSEVFYHLAFYYHIVAKNLYSSNKIAVCLAMCVRVLEVYLTGYLMKHFMAKPHNKRIKIKNDKGKWVNANGFGAIWGCFKLFYPGTLPTHLENEVDSIVSYRNISFYGHGYLSLTKARAETAIDTIRNIIFEIESNSNSTFFSKCDLEWVYLDNDLHKGLLSKGFSLA